MLLDGDDLVKKLNTASSVEGALQIAVDAGLEAYLSVEDEGKSWFLLASQTKQPEAYQSPTAQWKGLSEPFPLYVFRLMRNESTQMLEVQDLRANRSYNFSPLPFLRNDIIRPKQNEQNLMLEMYKEICSTWRMLTDVRFKLLGFVPVLSGALLIGVLTRPGSEGGLSVPVRLGLTFLGLMVTAALYIYDQRNSELYNELISRGRRIEAELGIDTGHFRGRPNARDNIIHHSTATDLIYGVTGFAWVFGFIMILMQG